MGLSWPTFDLSYFPYDLTLGDGKIDVDLDDWGSGTRNRILVLLTIFRARQVAESDLSTSKVTPIIVIEEPESFLHPSAQAEFGRILQELAEEFKVQIIVTTHSPYMLNYKDPESNILLERRSVRRQLRQTERVDTSGENWMEPFAQALGLRDKSFHPWREIFLSGSRSILLVEGDVDKQYFEMLRGERHGDKRLRFNGDIFSYGGFGSLKSQTLLRFIKDKFGKIFITFDLDAENEIAKTLEELGFEKNRSYLPLGLNRPGKRCIEGLLPDSIRKEVYSSHPDLVDALQGMKDERQEAKRKLKQLLFEKFKEVAVPGEEYFGRFYEVVRVINRSLSEN